MKSSTETAPIIEKQATPLQQTDKRQSQTIGQEGMYEIRNWAKRNYLIRGKIIF